MRTIVVSLLIALALAISSGCRRPPDIRRLCEKKCLCGCNIDECVQFETAWRDRFRKGENCSKKVDEMTECEIETGYCIKDRTGHIGMASGGECGEILTHLAGCGTLP
jgi:hypothetical protein